MSPANSAALSIFADALDRPSADRPAFLDAACGGDDALRAELADLLAAHEQAGEFLMPSARSDRTAVDGDTPADPAPAFQPTTTRTDVSLPPLGPTPLPTTLGGYRIERLLGEGGMGAVYLAHDDKLGRPVALKTMRPEMASRPGAIERFLREAQSTARVAHDNVVPILHVGEDAGVPYIAMPLLVGESLDALLRRETVPPLGMVLKIGWEIADGLAAAHACGLVHRDIKPANVWLEGNPDAADPAARFRRVKVLDFGLARPAATDTQLTGTGAVLGTPAYMSPEQARGEPVDARTDLFSLGVVLYRMTTGRLPFVGPSTMAVLTSLAVDTPPAPAARNAAVPRALSKLILRLLAKRRDGRPASAADVAAALRQITSRLPAVQQVFATPSQPGGCPVPLGQPVEPQFNPWTEAVEGIGLPRAAAETHLPTPAASSRPHNPSPVRRWRARGMWAVASVAAVFAVLSVRPGETPSPPPPPPDADFDRDAAKAVLALGGTVRVNGRGYDINTAADLPDEKFRLTWAALSNVAQVTDGRLAPLAACAHLNHIDLNNTSVTDDGLGHFDKLADLGELSLERTQMTGAGLAHLSRLINLMHLNLGDNPAVGGTGLAHLHGMSQLERLNLNGSGVTDEGLAHLAGLTALGHLHLSGTGLTHSGLAHLTRLKNLRWLELVGQPVGDEGLEHLTALTALEHLDLSGATKVSEAGVAKLLRALPRCVVLWDEMPRQPDAVAERAAAEWVISLGGSVRVNDGKLDLKVAGDLPQRPFYITSVNLSSKQDRVTDSDLVLFKHCDRLTELKLNGCAVTDKGLACFKDHKELTRIELGGTRVTDAGLAIFKDQKNLTGLVLGHTNITDAVLPRFAGGTKLQELNVSYTRVTDAGLASFKNCQELSVLILQATAVTDEGISNFKNCKKITTLNLSHTSVTDAGLSCFAGCKSLENLYLYHLSAGDNGLAPFKECRDLVRVALSGTGVTDAGVEWLKECPKLKELYMGNTKVTSEAGAEIAKALPGCFIEWSKGVIRPTR